MSQQRQVYDLSIMTIIKFFVVVLILGFIYLIRDIIAVLFVSLILTAAINPPVEWLAKRKIPRAVSVLFIYVVLLSLIGVVIYLLVPPMIHQIIELANNFPAYFEKFAHMFQDWNLEAWQNNNNFESISSNISNAFNSVIETVTSVFGGVFSLILVLVVTFYMSVEQNAVKRLINYFVPAKSQPFVTQLINKVQKKIASWLRAQLILCLIVGFLVYIILLLAGVQYALVLALLAAIGELIPYVGPIVSAIPAIILAFLQSPLTAIVVLIAFIVMQQLENHILVPKIMQKAVGLNPIISIIALLVGAKLAGILGVVLAIPVATAVMVVVQEIFGRNHEISTEH